MGSTRLPGKALYPLGGTTVLGFLLKRLKRCEALDRVVVATTTLPEDEPLVRWAAEGTGGWVCYDEPDDVLGRFLLAAEQLGDRDVVVRLTGDNPLVCPEVVDWCARWVASGRHDYYRTGPSFPEGLDVEAFTVALLRRIDRGAPTAHEREHLAAPLERLAERMGVYDLPEDWGHVRLTLDYPADVGVVQRVAAQVGPGAGLRDILRLARDEPEWFLGNQQIERNEWKHAEQESVA
jgi:glutamate-1-semialdehyde 2,1-aminomutase